VKRTNFVLLSASELIQRNCIYRITHDTDLLVVFVAAVNSYQRLRVLAVVWRPVSYLCHTHVTVRETAT